VFNVGGPEIVVILIVALLILGPDQLPKAMRTFGNVMGEIRKVSGGFQAEMKKAMDTIDISGSEKGDPPVVRPTGRPRPRPWRRPTSPRWWPATRPRRRPTRPTGHPQTALGP
jgi:Tat protein translocase TatB subunit